MTLQEHKAEIAIATTVCTILQYLSGVLVCTKFIKRGSSNDISPLPFLCGAVSSSLWVSYGYLKADPVILIVNGAGLFLMTTYVVFYLLYSTKRTLVVKKISIVTLFMFIVQIYSKTETNLETVKNNLGYLGSCMSLIFLAAPLSNLVVVLKTKSCETLPFPMIVMNLVVSTLWTTYGFILKDDFLIYPNAVGCILSGFQLSLFVKYPSTSR